MADQKFLNDSLMSVSCRFFKPGILRHSVKAKESNKRILLGPQPAEDAWGSRIPSRTEVEPGTKGSRVFVAARQGEAWAERMESVA